VDFRRDLMPIIRDRCVPCHGADQVEPHLDGSLQVLGGQSASAGVNRDYASLLAHEATDDPNALVGRYVQPGRARTSPLIWHILGRNTSRPWDGAASERAVKPIPPGQIEPLTSEQKQMFVEWIDLGAPWGETADR
jgi:hypothetical protein